MENSHTTTETAKVLDEYGMFTMTKEGYAKAKEYLQEIGKLDEFKGNKISVDGFSLIAYANHAITLQGKTGG